MEYTLEKFEKEVDISAYVQDYVNVTEFLEYCKQCPSYGNIWSCPPYNFDPMDIWNSYRSILIWGYRLTFGEDRTRENMWDALWTVKKQVSRELFDLEAKLPGSRSLSAGSCQLCGGCTRPSGKPCRNQEHMRYSIESLGGDVGRTLSRLCGIELEWETESQLPEHFVLCGGLLKK